MTIPAFWDFMLPVLDGLADGRSKHWRELRDHCAAVFELTDEDRSEPLANGGLRLDSRVQWANTYLYQAGLISRTGRGMVQLDDDGHKLLSDPPVAITRPYLEDNYVSFREFLERSRQRRKDAATDDPGAADAYTPVENMSAAIDESEAALRHELLRRVRQQPPDFLERLVLRLLDEMGYSGQNGALEHTGGAGDGGIDGIIHQDPLGIDRIYLQAKRYAKTVGPNDIREFVGALGGVHADRGVFIATSAFSENARDYLQRANNRVVLIDGEQLVELMVEHNVGVQPEQTFVVNKIDENFFD